MLDVGKGEQYKFFEEAEELCVGVVNKMVE